MAASSAAAASIVNSQQQQRLPGSNTTGKPIVDDNSTITAEEAAELARIEAEADGEEAVRTEGMYEERRGTRGKIQKKPWFIIDPRTSKFISYWDGISMVALIFTAIVTFVEVAFVESSGKVDGLFIINRLVDTIFIVDVFLNFCLMYPYQGPTPTDTVRWIHDPAKIRWHYIRTWFFIDIFSIAVSGFDFLALDSLTGGGGSGTSSFKVFRIVRVARLIKLVRLVRSSRIMKRFESRVAINYGHLALVKCLVGLLIASHWFACIWGLITTFEKPIHTWYYHYGYCELLDDPYWASMSEQANMGNTTAEALYAAFMDDDSSVVCMSPVDRYIASLYWAIMTITSIGYGDIAAVNTFEKSICSVLMLAGGMVWGSVIATFCGVIASLDPKGAEFRKTMDDLNSFMDLQGLPNEMRIQLREYFHQTKHLQIARANKSLIENMSPMLQGQVVWKINERWLRHVWFLRAAEDKFMVQLSLNLAAAVFAPGELCPNGYMYISHRGIALYGGRVLTSGKVWGEDMILSSPHLRSKYAARCMTYVEVYMIARDDLLNIAKSFPPTLRIIRRSAFRLAFRREMIRRAKDNLIANNEMTDEYKGSAAEKLMVSISSKENHVLDSEAPLAIEPHLPIAAPGAANTTTDANFFAALDARLSQQHSVLMEKLEAFGAQLDAFKGEPAPVTS